MTCRFSGLALEVLIQKVCAGAQRGCAGWPCARPVRTPAGSEDCGSSWLRHPVTLMAAKGPGLQAPPCWARLVFWVPGHQVGVLGSGSSCPLLQSAGIELPGGFELECPATPSSDYQVSLSQLMPQPLGGAPVCLGLWSHVPC